MVSWLLPQRRCCSLPIGPRSITACLRTSRPSKVIAIGLNYLDHIRETHATAPTFPVSFAKYSSSLNDPFGAIIGDPAVTAEPDFEAELAVVIGRRAFSVTAESALGCVFGYAVANDASARDLQRLDPQLSRSKNLDTGPGFSPRPARATFLRKRTL